jgi:hypothetical protein
MGSQIPPRLAQGDQLFPLELGHGRRRPWRPIFATDKPAQAGEHFAGKWAALPRGHVFLTGERKAIRQWDGIRALAAVDATGWRLWGRQRADYTARYPELDVLRGLPAGTLVDGELVAFAPDGRPELPRLLRRHGLTDAWRIRQAARWCPVMRATFRSAGLVAECLLLEFVTGKGGEPGSDRIVRARLHLHAVGWIAVRQVDLGAVDQPIDILGLAAMPCCSATTRGRRQGCSPARRPSRPSSAVPATPSTGSIAASRRSAC